MKFLFTTDPDPVPPPLQPPPEEPFLKEWHQPICQIIMLVVNTTLLILVMTYIEDYVLNKIGERGKAIEKAKKMMAELGLKDLKLNTHEYLIAANIITPRELDVNWSQVGGLNDIVENLKNAIILPLEARKTAHKNSNLIRCPRGILLHGPPGCGKTLLAKAISKEIKCCFINVDITSLLDKFFGESEKLVKAVFTLAVKVNPCIIFIDEIDAMLRKRSFCDNQISSHTKTQFMTLWDGLLTDPNKIVIVLGATNRPADLDKAILRRMTIKQCVPLPNTDQRKSILDVILKNENLDPDVDMKILSEKTKEFSGSDLKDMCESAAINCLVKSKQMETPYNINDYFEDSSEQLDQPRDYISYLKKINSETKNWLVPVPTYMFGRLPIHNQMEMKNNDNHEEENVLNNNALLSNPISMDDFELAITKAIKAKEFCNANW